MDNGRPVVLASLALNYYSGKLNPFGYHLVNILIHILTAITVYLFLELTLNLPGLKERYAGQGRTIAALTGFLFLVHPLQTQAVSYIIQRASSMAALFFVLSLYCYAKARLADTSKRAIYFICCALSMLLAFGSKQNTFTLPLFIALYEYYFFQRLELGTAKKKWLYAGIGIISLIVLLGGIYTDFDIVNIIRQGYGKRAFTPRQRVLTQARVVIFYISLLIAPLPSRLNIDHHFPLSYSLINPFSTLICFALALSIIFISVYIARKRPLISYALIWFWGNLILESSIIPLEMVFEHRLYLPAMGFFLLVSILLVKLARQTKGIMIAIVLVLIIPLSAFTYQRNKVWQNGINLWEDAVRKSPDKARSRRNLAYVYEDKGRLREAVIQYRHSLRLEPGAEQVHSNLGNVYTKLGKLEQAAAEYLKEIELYPENAAAFHGLGNVYAEMGKLTAAAAVYRRCLRIDPGLKDAHNNLGIVYIRQGKQEQAVAELSKEIKYHPDNAKAYYNLGNALRDQGRKEEAVFQYRRCLQINPAFKNAHDNIGSIYLQSGKREPAVAEFYEELRINFKNAKVHKNLGVIYLEQGNSGKAVLHFRKSLEIAPQQPQAAQMLRFIANN